MTYRIFVGILMLLFFNSCNYGRIITCNMVPASPYSTDSIRYSSIGGKYPYMTISDVRTMGTIDVGRYMIFTAGKASFELVRISDSIVFTTHFRRGRPSLSYIKNTRTNCVFGLVTRYSRSGRVAMIRQYKDGDTSSLIYYRNPFARRKFDKTWPKFDGCRTVESAISNGY